MESVLSGDAAWNMQIVPSLTVKADAHFSLFREKKKKSGSFVYIGRRTNEAFYAIEVSQIATPGGTWAFLKDLLPRLRAAAGKQKWKEGSAGLVVQLGHVNSCLCEQTHPLEPTLALLVQIGNYRAPAYFHVECRKKKKNACCRAILLPGTGATAAAQSRNCNNHRESGADMQTEPNWLAE